MQRMTSHKLLDTKFKHIVSGITSFEGDSYEGFSIFNAAGDIKLNIIWTFKGQNLKDESPKCVDKHLHNVELLHESEKFILVEEQGKSVIDGLVTRLKWEKYACEELEKRFEFRKLSFEPFYIERDKNLPLKFMGTNLGSASEEPLNFTLYWTKEGQFVCERNFDTSESNNRDHTAEICSTVSEIYNFIGNHELAKQLIQAANVDFSIVVK